MNKLITIVCALLCCSYYAQAQFTTPTITGSAGPSIASGEYGTHTNGQNQQTTGASTWYCTWDDTFIYFAVAAANQGETASIFFDINPTKPGNVGTDADGTTFRTFDGQNHDIPFRADFAVHAKNDFTTGREILRANGTNGWTSVRSGGGAFSGGTNDYNDNFYATGSSNDRELKIRWTDLNAGGRPASFRWIGMLTYNNGSYAKVPTNNPTGTASGGRNTGADNYFYYEILNTATGTATKPFAVQSFTCYDHNVNAGAADAFIYNTTTLPSTLHNFVVNDYSADNNDNLPGAFANTSNYSNRVYLNNSITIQKDLYVGLSSSFVPNTNTVPSVTMNGTGGQLTIKGRLGCNPNDGTAADVTATDMRFVFDGTTYFMNTGGLNQDRVRFSDITINTTKSFIADAAAGNNTFEMQDGAVTNNGTFDMWYDNSNYLNLFTRGDINAYHNEVTFQGTGVFTFNNLGIGRRTTGGMNLSLSATDPNFLTPNTTQDVTLNIKGNFQNYAEFRGVNAAGKLRLVFNGSQPQKIMGNYQETRRQNSNTGDAITEANSVGFPNTTGGAANDIPRTVIPYLEVNTGSTLTFESDPIYGSATVSTSVNTNVRYIITKELKLSNGRLITRKDVSCPVPGVNYHIVTLMDGATHTGVSPGNSYVDGPIRWEVKNTSLPKTCIFATGKNGPADRQQELTVSAQTQAAIVYQGEMMNCMPAYSMGSASQNGKPAAEEILAIPGIRHWNMNRDDDNVFGGAAASAAQLKIHYKSDDYGLTNGVAKFRIVKNQGGGSQWLNTGGSGATAGAGTILSDNFTTFSSFTNGAVGPTPLPVTLISFTASRNGKTVDVKWATASEKNNDYFDVERSIDGGKSYAAIGRVHGNGTTATQKQYLFSDNNPSQTTENCYRLKQVDFDGNHEYTDIKCVNFGATNTGVTVRPNPVYDRLQVNLAADTKGSSEIQIIDMLGKVVHTQVIDAGTQTVNLDVQNLVAGAYIVRVQTGTQASVVRFVKN